MEANLLQHVRFKFRPARSRGRAFCAFKRSVRAVMTATRRLSNGLQDEEEI